MRAIGLHLRLLGSYTDMIEKAVRLEIPIFQCFLLSQQTGSLLPLSDQDVASFLKIRRTHCKETYVHGSYRINLAGANDAHHFSLFRELTMAKRLEFTYMILHPGSFVGFSHKQEGIQAMARTLNKLMRYEHDITIVLENAAHGTTTVGNDIDDFSMLRLLLDQPEKVRYCIDTAHAYAYGYALNDSQARTEFIDIVHKAIGLENIVLLHLNDTYETLGSKKDRHAPLGDGTLGIDALKAWALDNRLRHIPIMLEMPEMDEHKEKEIVATVKTWHKP